MSHLLNNSCAREPQRSFESKPNTPFPMEHCKPIVFAELFQKASATDSDVDVEKIHNSPQHSDYSQHSYLLDSLDMALARPKSVPFEYKASIAVMPEGHIELMGDLNESENWKFEDDMLTFGTIETSTQTATKQPVEEWVEVGSKILGDQQAVAVHTARKRRVLPSENCDLNSAHLAQLEDLAVAQEASPFSRPQTYLLGGNGRAANELQVLILKVQELTSVFVQLPAMWDIARHKVRDLIAGRVSALGVPLEEVAVVAVQESQPLTPLFSKDPKP